MSTDVGVRLLLCGLTWNLVTVTSGVGETPVKVGVLVFPEILFYAKQALDSCPAKEKINLTAINVEMMGGGSVLEQAGKLKSSIDEDYFALIGPLYEAAALVTEAVDVPFLATETSSYGNSRNVYYILPGYRDVIECISAIVKANSWKSIGMIWENSADDTVLADFMESLQIDVKMFRVRHSGDREIRNILHRIRQLAIRDIVLLTSQEITWEILNVARRIGVLSIPYSYIVLDRSQTDVEDVFSDLQTNVTIIRLMSNRTTRFLTSFPPHLLRPMHVEAIIDSVMFICDVIMTSGGSQLDGLSLADAIEKARQSVSDTTIMFGEDRRRTGFTWDIYSYSNYRLTKTAEWIKGNGPNYRSGLQLVHPEGILLRPHWPRKRARVVSILEKPWMMLKDPSSNCTANSCYEGFVVDMMSEIAKLPIFDPPFDYELYIVPDGLFGSLDPITMEWNGLMGEIISGNATLSLAPLSINKEREEAVDFTKPFKTRGITMLIKTPEYSPTFFQFLSPLSHEVWGMILLAMVVTSVALSMYEKYGTRQRRDLPPIIGLESCWFAIGTLMQEGTEVSPVTVPGRILTAAWWFFAMILISSYTANLAAFLTLKKINSPVESISDLVGQTKIKYGTVRDSGVLSFFLKTQIEPYRTMATRMGPDVLVNSTAEGLERVLQGSYAFLWDDTVNGYIAATDCRFTEVGEPFDYKGFGIGVPSGASYRENLTLAVLSLADNGILDILMDKWWKAGECHTPEESNKFTNDTEELKLENIAGIFIVLAAGLLLGLVACLIDKFTNLLARKKKDDIRGVVGTTTNAVPDQFTNNTFL